MKKILAALMLVLFVGCAGPQSGKKVEVTSPPPAPSQEEVLKQSKAELEIKEFEAWWTEELPIFYIFVASQMPVAFTLETKQLELLFDNKIGMVWVRLSDPLNPADFADLYVVATKPNGKWGVATIVFRSDGLPEPPDVKEDTVEVEPDEQKL